MSISRRKFIQTSALTLVAVGVPMASSDLAFGQDGARGVAPIIGPGDIPFASQQDPVFFFTKDTFAPYVNTSFEVLSSDGRRANFTLTAVDEFQAKGKLGAAEAGRTQTYSLFFTGGKGLFPADSYTVNHAALGMFTLFIVPIVSRNTQIYQAVISHLIR
ncbi:MAG: hypothetical protein ABIP75_05140 [Pyrinomonadaceae bacterium]